MADDDDHHDHHQDPPPDPALRVKALETLLADRGYIDPKRIDEIVDLFQNRIGPRNGAKVIAKAWTDRAYHARLLADATSAIAELGFSGGQGEHMIAVENSPSVHNLVVCTLCSCYPVPVLGLPPVWYKSNAYRSRAVRDPRAVLREFGVVLGDGVEVRVWDSTSELRYLVVPERPPGSEGMSEEALSALVTRDAMIGTAIVKAPT
jgi:nitrile hydratase